MKQLISFAAVCMLFFLSSCASKNIDTQQEVKIARATMRLGQEYYNAGNYTAALKTLLESQKTIPDDPDLNNSLGLVYLAKERYNLAEEHLKKALKEKKDFIEAKNNLGAVYLKMEKWDTAITYFEEVSRDLLYPSPEIPLSNLGWAYFHQGLYKQSRYYFDEALMNNPEYLVAFHGIASILIQTKQYDKAQEMLHYQLKKQPGAAILHSDLARIYEEIKQYKQARRSWNLVLKLAAPNSSLARDAQKKLLELPHL